MRRLVGLLSMLLMLALSFAGGDLVCAGRHHRGGHTVPVAAQTDAHHQHTTPASDHCKDDDSCTRPSAASCCGALPGCTTTVLAAAGTETSTLSRVIERPVERVAIAPTRHTAPETPPPRV